MNLIEFAIKAGFPLSESTLEYMQGMMQQSQNSGLLGGSTYIVSGCADAGATIGNGYVVINGEALEFVGGAVQAYVIVVETRRQREFFGGALNDYYIDRVATFGTGAVQYAWSGFKRNDPANGVLARLDKVEKMLKPLMGYTVSGTTYYGSWLFWGRPAGEIPAGWEAVPDADWKGKIPVVLNSTDADFDTVGETGGSKTFTIAQTNLPHVQLDVTVPVGATSTDSTGSGKLTGGGSSNEPVAGPTLKTEYLGDGTSLKHLLPYKVVMFIRFIG